MKIELLILTVLSLLIVTCKEENEKFSPNIFGSSIGAQWIYVDNRADTTTWTFTGIKRVNGIECAEITVETKLAKNLYYYYQTKDKIVLTALELPRTAIDLSNPMYDDTLVVLNSSSLEYVFTRHEGYSWDRNIVTFTASGPTDVAIREERFKMTVIGREVITTEAGTFDCQKIQDAAGQLYFVSDKGLIRKAFTGVFNNQLIEFNCELIKIN